MGTSPRSPELEEELRRVRQEYVDTPNLRLTPLGSMSVSTVSDGTMTRIFEGPHS